LSLKIDYFNEPQQCIYTYLFTYAGVQHDFRISEQETSYKERQQNSLRKEYAINQCLINTMGVTSGAGTAYPSGFSGVRVTRSLVLYVCFVDRCLSFCTS
jgi:hypothetical protein